MDEKKREKEKLSLSRKKRKSSSNFFWGGWQYPASASHQQPNAPSVFAVAPQQSSYHHTTLPLTGTASLCAFPSLTEPRTRNHLKVWQFSTHSTRTCVLIAFLPNSIRHKLGETISWEAAPWCTILHILGFPECWSCAGGRHWRGFERAGLWFSSNLRSWVGIFMSSWDHLVRISTLMRNLAQSCTF